MPGVQQMSKVPISGTVDAPSTQGNNNVYTVNLKSTAATTLTGVGLSVPSGCSVSPTTTDVPATGVNVTVNVPVSNTGGVDLTVSKSGYTSATVTVQQAN